ncbi:putative F-box/FBD/LRR-repeat protein At4g00315 [Rutidosis leptorrhynchoides]|uniref:putative F-box/FBD/LRR-repeat protein At4g00315 n=1 Tax=Rutidosis leptorrhynchoides TaxID=125765 RepID=UPI003A99BCDF
MDFDHNNVRAALDKDRLSALPLELIHEILSRFETKFVVQTCLLLSPRWKLIWTSMPSLNFSSTGFKTLSKFAKFVKHVLSHRNHQVEVSSVNLRFYGSASQVFVRKIVRYLFSHNVQKLKHFKHELPPCLFSSKTLKHLTIRTCTLACLTPKIPWDFPALTTLYVDDITLCDDECESVDLFSKCVNLQNLTLENITVKAKVFDIITPRLSNLILRFIGKRDINFINVIAPQLENLTAINCSMKYLNIPSGFSSFCYEGCNPPRWYKDSIHSVKKVSVSLNLYRSEKPYKHEDARCIINMLQQLHSARFLTLNLDIVECISSFPNLLSGQASPFSKLIWLNIDSGTRDTCKLKMPTEARNFLLENSPNTTFIMKELPTQELKEKELKANIEDLVKELEASLEQDNMITERNQAIGMTKVVVENLVDAIKVWTKKKTLQNESERGQIEEIVTRLEAQLWKSVVELTDMFTKANQDVVPLILKKGQVRCLLDRLPKKQRKQMEAHYSRQFKQAKALIAHQASNNNLLHMIIDAFRKDRSSTSEDVSTSESTSESSSESSSESI